MTRWSCGFFLLAFAVAGCDSTGPEEQLVIVPRASVYHPGEFVEVDARNASRSTVWLGQCIDLYRQSASGTEVKVEAALPCPAELHTLEPGASMTLTGVIPAVEPGEYRAGAGFWRDSELEIRAETRSAPIRVEAR